MDCDDKSSGFKLTCNVHHAELTEGRLLSECFSIVEITHETEALGIVGTASLSDQKIIGV